MIGDLFSTLATAQKLDINQIQRAVQDGTLPAYVGVPLLQQKMQQRQEAAALLAGQQQKQPPIAKQIMDQASQMSEPIAAPAPQGIEQALQQQPQETQGIDTAPSNMPQQFAGGGIVAFAEGDLVGDDSDAEKEDQALFSRLLGGISMPQSYESALAEKGYTPQSLRDLVRKTRKDDLGNYVAPPEGARGHKYEDVVLQEAKRQGLDPNLALHVLYKETGGLSNPESARSKAGALGVMQLMPKTAKGLGVDPLDPQDNIRGGVMYLKQMMDKYQDPVMAAAAYNAGPGNVDKAIRSGRGIAALPRETQNYVPKGYAGGGIVAFDDGGTVDNPYAMMGDIGMATPDYQGDTNYGIGDYIKRKLMGIQDVPAKPATPAKPVAPAQTVSDITKTPITGADFQVAKPAAPQAAPTPTEAPDDGLGDIRSMIKESMAESKKQKEIDAWMSLLSSAFGTWQAAGDIRPGKVHTAFGDISAGGQQGLGYYAQAAKQRADEQKGLLAAQLGLSRADLYEKLRRDALAQKAAETKYAQGIKGRQLDLQGQALALKRGDLMRKAATDWENSSDKADLVKDLTKRSKNWQQDSKLLGEYNLKKNKYMNQFVGGEEADNALSASDLLNQ